MLRIIRLFLIVLFLLALLGAGFLFFYNYTHQDVQPPTFVVDSDLIEVSVSASDEELCRGLHAYDDRDGDITSRIMIQSTSKLINATDVTATYLVFDDASNYARCQRTVRYTDYVPPKFNLSKPMIYNVGDTITFLDRVSAYDVRDGNITGRVTLSESTVVSNVPGIYDAVLSVTNRLGDMVSLPLTVTIVSRTTSMPQLALENYLIYTQVGRPLSLSRNIKSVFDPMAEVQPTAAQVRINALNLDTSTPGIYEVYYYYTGVSGEITTVILTVIVE